MNSVSTRASVQWIERLRFDASAGGQSLVVDGDREAGCSPMELLLISLAGCMSIDIVLILQKMRATLTSVGVGIEGTRAESPPRRFTRIVLRYEVSGTGIREGDLQRAITLSREKYCSVVHTLQPDLELEIDYELET